MYAQTITTRQDMDGGEGGGRVGVCTKHQRHHNNQAGYAGGGGGRVCTKYCRLHNNQAGYAWGRWGRGGGEGRVFTNHNNQTVSGRDWCGGSLHETPALL